MAFKVARSLGYDGVEVVVSADPASRDRDALLRLVNTYEVPVLAVHAPCLLLSQGFWLRGPFQRLVQSSELARALGARTVVVHPPFAWQRRYAHRFVADTGRLSAETGTLVAVENMYPWPTERAGLPGHALHWDPTRYDYSHLTLDLSHASASGTDALDLLGRMGSRLAHLHLSDGHRRGFDEHLVPGRGSQPCAAVIERLATSGFTGIVTHEIRPPLTHAGTTAALADALAFTREHSRVRCRS